MKGMKAHSGAAETDGRSERAASSAAGGGGILNGRDEHMATAHRRRSAAAAASPALAGLSLHTCPSILACGR